MTTHVKSSVVVTVILMTGLTAAPASEPNDSSVSLTFEIQSNPLGPLSSHEVYRRGGSEEQAFALLKPPYAAAIPLVGPTGYLIRPGSPMARRFLGSASRDERLSAAQKRFLQTTEGLLDAGRGSGPVPQKHRPRGDPNAPEQLLLYAMSLDDAKAMAEAYVEQVMEDFQRDADREKVLIARKEQAIATASERLRELERVIETSGPALEAHKQKVPYRTEEEAAEAIAELDRMLNAARVDIAGIRARLGAIQQHLRTGRSPYDEAIKAKLQTMFVEESVALDGAEARKEMATQLRADANRFLDLHKSFSAAMRDIGAARELPGRHLAELQKMQRQFEGRVLVEKPRIAEQGVAIYPVEWAREAGDPGVLGPAN